MGAASSCEGFTGRVSLSGTHTGELWSCGETQTAPRFQMRTGSGPGHLPVRTSFQRTCTGELVWRPRQWRSAAVCPLASKVKKLKMKKIVLNEDRQRTAVLTQTQDRYNKRGHEHQTVHTLNKRLTPATMVVANDPCTQSPALIAGPRFCRELDPFSSPALIAGPRFCRELDPFSSPALNAGPRFCREPDPFSSLASSAATAEVSPTTYLPGGATRTNPARGAAYLSAESSLERGS
ncbi:uncharacterized protein LOC128569038 [Nycticebus coucang]|uniref:uncharacterized protein LOC128569038 n=1 Tax=Nycticebus coucang TaxID=9470 RepID=UPI00234DF927|nr:uncharacterized protein LOC128569038 [Nycticebus coucang]